MALKSEPFVSVVTPVYNTEKYLAECIESVVNQTYQNLEYLIVNNCSTDSSLEIAQHYARGDKRIRICNNETFLDLMQNWNHAVSLISPESKYCKVVHADDWLFPECIARMVEIAEGNPSVGVVGAYRLDEDRVNLDGLPYPSTVVSGHKMCRWSLLGGPYIFGSPTSILLRSNLIRKRRRFYNESNIHADKEICFEVLKDVDFGFVHQVLTFTRRHNETVSTFSRRFDTYAIDNIAILKKYGPVYLDADEYQKRLSQLKRGYTKYLVKNIFDFREKAFFEYHKKALNKMDFRISVVTLLKYSLLELLDLKSNAKRIRSMITKVH